MKPRVPDYEAGMDAYSQRDYVVAYRMWQPLAKQGDVNAQFMLGLLYIDGEGVPLDEAEATHWFRKVAEQGDASAQLYLSDMYADGRGGVPRDKVEEARWFRKAVEQGEGNALDELGNRCAGCDTDAERLLMAVGEEALRQGLPASLLTVLESDGIALDGAQVANAAIATYHTDALRHYRRALARFDPPKKWAGSQGAVDFVRWLGFSVEWAGERRKRRDPYLDVEGPYSLPDLHEYQLTVAENVRAMLRKEKGKEAGRRGLISMPTGSGKTRVAVQAIVEAMRDDGFYGGVLWIADRDELCEQAVEAWRQVWSSVGVRSSRLRISRLWGRQTERPLPTSERHVIVATIQTLNERLSSQGDEYGFLSDFKLVVFDEAHRSIAPTFTSVMQELGLTRFQRTDEPFLLGLTATPYRGHDETETARLVRRYGSNRLDTGAFSSDDPQAVIQELQDMGVLAQADHETIEGETFSADMFSPRELEQAKSLPWLPQSVEDRMARSVGEPGVLLRRMRHTLIQTGPPLSSPRRSSMPRPWRHFSRVRGSGHVLSVERRRRPRAAEWLKSSGVVRSGRS